MRCFLIACILLAPTVASSQSPAPVQPPKLVPRETERAQQVAGKAAVYPRIAVIAHVEGCVYVGIVISTGGSVKHEIVLAGPALMAQSAVTAVMTLSFRPPSEEVSTVVPVCYFLLGDNRAKLLSSYQKTAAKDADNPGKLVTFGTELLLRGLPEQAADQFRQALSLKPRDSDAEFGLGDSLAAQDRLDAAVTAYQQGLTVAPKDVRARERFAELLRLQGDFDGAIAQYKALVKVEPYLGLNLGGLLLEKGDFDGAIEAYHKALRQGNDWFAHYHLGQAYEKKGDTANALKEYKIAMNGMPKNQEFREAYNRLAGK